jgi:hypothetical protein
MILALLLTLAPPAHARQAAPADAEAERILGDFIAIRSGGIWHAESYNARAAAIEAEPERFAPILRERLSRLPATLDEYDPDDPKWVVNAYAAPRRGAQSASLLGAVELLGREHAEPILQEFFDRVNPLALEATRRYWRERDIANAAGRKTGRELVDAKEVYLALSGARGQAIKVAKNLDSDTFHDDFLVMLTSDDTVAQTTGAAYTRGSLDEILERRPEAIPQVVEAAARLSASEDPRVAEAGRSLTTKIRETLPIDQRDDAQTDPRR